MKIDRSKNVKRNLLFGWIDKIVHMFFPFVIRTLIINELGAEYLGLNSLFTSLLQILSLAELGFDSSVVFILYRGVANNDIKLQCALLNFLKRTYLIVGGIILVIGLICLPFIQYVIKDTSSLPSDINIYYIYLVFLFNTVVGYFFGAYRNSILYAYQRNDVLNKINISIYSFFAVLQVLLLLIIKDYYYYLYTLPLCTLFTNLTVVYITKNKFPQINAVGYISDKEKSELKKLVSGTFFGKIGTILSVAIDNIVISSFLGVTMLAYYTNYSYVITAIQGVLVVVYSAIQGGIGNSLILESVSKNLRDLNKFTFLYNWIVGWCFYSMIFLFQPFVKIWIGEQGVLPMGIVILICINFYSSVSFGILGTYKQALGIVWEDRYRPLIGGIVNCSLNVLFVLLLRNYDDSLALAGVTLSTIIAHLLIDMPWSIHLTFKKYFKNGKGDYYLSLLRYFTISTIAIILSYPIFSFVDTLTSNNIALLFVRLLLCLLLPNIIFLFSYRKLNEQKEAFEFIKNKYSRNERTQIS